MRKNKQNRPLTFPSQVLSKKYLISICILLFVLVSIVVFLFYRHLSEEKVQKYDPASLSWQGSSKLYMNHIGNFTIEYPSTWTLNESHTVSNRVVDNPNEINTAKLTGKEGEILIEWGPMGFGGGCDPKDHKMFSIKNKTVDICQSIDDQGNEYWAGIGNGHTDDSIAEIIYAEAYKPYSINAKIIEEILANIIFN